MKEFYFVDNSVYEQSKSTEPPLYIIRTHININLSYKVLPMSYRLPPNYSTTVNLINLSTEKKIPV